MMPSDNLTHEERRRLEAVAQAIGFGHMRRTGDEISIESILCVAAIIDVFVAGGKIEAPANIDNAKLTVKVAN